jgi:O-antigen/teichoic acid export membrane protein
LKDGTRAKQVDELGMSTDQVPDIVRTPTAKRSAARGALWITVGTVSIGLSNYGYSLLLTHLLNVAEYSVFSAGQSLILWATNIATVSVPWVLAQALARAKSERERNSAIRFAKLMSGGTGIAAGIIVGGIAIGLSGPATAVVVAVGTLVIFLGTTTSGWLQGDERMRSLSLLYIAENVLKNAGGILLVTVAGLKGIGALAGFGIGGLAMLARWPRARGDGKRSWRQLVNKELLSHAIAIAGAQGLVSLFIAVDVVLVALLPGNRALAASYQASTTLTRIPLYIAGAVAIAYFPSLSRQASSGVIAAQALRLYAATGLPLMVILATIPGPLVTSVFPSGYGSVDLMLKYTAVTGFAAGGISLVTTFFQAANDYSCLRWLGAGLGGYVIALIEGWRVDGVAGLAAGGALGSAVALAAIVYRLVRSRGLVVLAWVRLPEAAMAAVALVLARPFWWLWLAVAFVCGLRAVTHFWRPGGRHEKLPKWATRHNAAIDEPVSVSSMLVDTVWRDDVPERSEEELNELLALGRLNRVEGRLAQLYPGQFASVRYEVQGATYLYTRTLHEAARRLNNEKIPAMLIETGIREFGVLGNIDLVIPERYWRAASQVFPDFESIYIEQHQTILFQPPIGQSLQVHSDLSWLGVQFLPANRLLARAVRSRDGILVPSRADYLRIMLSHALVQQRELDLSQLLILWDLIRRPAVIMTACAEARQEGWQRGFEEMLALAGDSINRMDEGQEITLPVRPRYSGRGERGRSVSIQGVPGLTA